MVHARGHVATTDYGHTNMWYSQMSKKSASTKERFATSAWLTSIPLSSILTTWLLSYRNCALFILNDVPGEFQVDAEF